MIWIALSALAGLSWWAMQSPSFCDCDRSASSD